MFNKVWDRIDSLMAIHPATASVMSGKTFLFLKIWLIYPQMDAGNRYRKDIHFVSPSLHGTKGWFVGLKIHCQKISLKIFLHKRRENISFWCRAIVPVIEWSVSRRKNNGLSRSTNIPSSGWRHTSVYNFDNQSITVGKCRQVLNSYFAAL